MVPVSLLCLIVGYNDFASDLPINEINMYALNSAGDLETLKGLFTSAPYKMLGLDCSSIVKVII